MQLAGSVGGRNSRFKLELERSELKQKLQSAQQAGPDTGSAFHRIWKIILAKYHPVKLELSTETVNRFHNSPAIDLIVQRITDLPRIVFPVIKH